MRSSRIVQSPFTVFCLFLVVYLLTRTSNFTGPHDSMAYLNMLKHDQGLWHPHHLLYHVMSKYWLLAWKMVFPSAADYMLVESFSCLWGAGVITMAFIFFRRRFDLLPVTAWLATSVIAFSYGIWFYSVNVEVYMPALFFTLWSLYLLSRPNWSSKQVWRIGIVHSLAILFHQMNVLLIPIVLYKIYTQRKNIYVFKSIFWYGLTGAVLVGGMYFIGGWVIEGHNDIDSWVKWVRGYTETNEYWRPLSWKTPLLAGMGFLRTLVGGQFIFQLGEMEAGMDNFLKTHALQDEVFLVRGLSQGLVWTMLALVLVLAWVLLVLLVQFISRFREKMRSWGHAIVPLLLYVLIYSTYFFFWMPEILEFWLGQCIILWLLLLGTFRPVGKRLNILAGLTALLLLVINYTSSIGPMQDIRNDIGYARIEKVKAVATSGDLAIVQNPWLLKEFLEYYGQARVMVAPAPNALEPVHSHIDPVLASGHRVYIFPEPQQPDLVPRLQKRYGTKMTLFQKELAEIWVIQ